MTIPIKTIYPEKYDTDYELKTVVDSLVSKTTTEIVPFDQDNIKTLDWENGKGTIGVDDISAWPSSGFATVYLKEHWGKALERATLFHYGSKDENSLLNVTIIPGQSIKYYPVNSVIVQNVVAQNHNYNKDSIIALEKYLGHRGTDDQTTIEWFADFYVKNIKVPKAWLNIYPAHIITTRSFEEKTTREVRCFTNDYIVFEDKTTRIQPGFSFNQDPKVQWILQFGDGSSVSIKLDVDTNEYVFDITSIDENSILQRRQERKKTWDKKIYHKYTSQGVYDVFLTVYNVNGRDELKLYEIVHIMDQAPHSLGISVSTSGVTGKFSTDLSEDSIFRLRARAVVDSINVSSNIVLGNNLSVKDYLWDIGPFFDPKSYTKTPYLNISFDSGGIFDIGLKVITNTGSYIGAFLEDAIDIVEKPSVWLGYNTKTSGDFYMNEYSIRSNTWKSNGLLFNLNYSYNIIGTETQNFLSFTNDKGFHYKPNTEESYILWSSSNVQLNTLKYNSLENVSTHLNELQRIHNWFTLYIPEYSDTGSDKVFILGGLLDVNNPDEINQEISYYEISSNSYKNVEVQLVSKQVPASNCTELDEKDCPLETRVFASPFAETLFDLIKNPGKKPAKWKTTSFGSKGYILRNSNNNDLLEDFFSFDPSEVVFREIQSAVPFAKLELGMDSLNNGVYIVSNAGDLFKYDPKTDSWTNTTISSTRNYTQAFYTSKTSSRDPNARIVTASDARSSNASNVDLYFCYDYDLDAFGKFNIEEFTFSKLSSRPPYPNESGAIDTWEMNLG